MRGVIAAGHPLTAEAGADILRGGGNAVDAAVAAALASFAVESPLTGFGAGGFMLIHDSDPALEPVLLDFFVETPGRSGVERREELVPLDVSFGETVQTFNAGPASCGVPGTAAGLDRALREYGSAPMGELIGPAVRHARDGAPLNAQQAYIVHILEPILTHLPECRQLYAPEGKLLREGDVFRFPELGDALERYAAEGPAPFYGGEVGQSVAAWVLDGGGTLSAEDMAAYEPAARQPAGASYRGTEVLTNPPPSSGGILIAYSLELLDRLGTSAVPELVEVTRAANARRGPGFADGLYAEGYLASFLDAPELDRVAAAIASGLAPGAERGGPGEGLGSTTHIAVIDAEGSCASLTCSNGTGSGVVVPGTGVHVNNMLGEEDLNPLGFHRNPAGRRMTSMMSPTVVLRDGEVIAALGSAGSNRIRSAVVQTIIRLIDDGMAPQAAVEAGRLHFEAGVVQAEPGVDEGGLEAVERHGTPVVRWERPNLFFGGVQAVARDRDGKLSGGGDPRRGGAVVFLD